MTCLACRIVTMPIGNLPHYFAVPDILAEKRWPTEQEFDVAVPDNPVFISFGSISNRRNRLTMEALLRPT